MKKKPVYREEQPDPIDVHVGRRIKARRAFLGINQKQLGKVLKLSFQQIQKYERGINRIGSSNLYRIACTLGVKVGWFFEDLDNNSRKKRPSLDKNLLLAPSDVVYERETLDMIKVFNKIENERVRHKIYEFTKYLGQDTD